MQSQNILLQCKIRFTKQDFLSIKPGHWILNNALPLHFAQVSKDSKQQWLELKELEGQAVFVFKTQADCQSMWWALTHRFKLSKAWEHG